jgi:hypothetical protein
VPGGATIIGAVDLLVVLFCCAIVAVGAGFTYFVDTPMRFEERIVHAVVIGTIVVSTVGFAVAWIAGVSRGAIIVATLGSLGLAGLGWGRDPAKVRAEFADVAVRFRLRPSHRDSPWLVVGLVVFAGAVSARIMGNAYHTTADGGIAAGHLSTFGDWTAHLAYAGSFAYGDNFPPELPTAAGETFAYHFGVDWFSAMFVPLGTSLPGGLEVSTWLLATAFPASMFCAAWRLVGRRLAALVGVAVFLASGGTAALYRFVFEDLLDGGVSVLGRLPRTYAFDGFDRNWVDNAITGFLYPQRPTMIGFGIVMILLAWLWQEREREGIRTHLFAGVVTGLMPVFHVFGFGVLLVMGLWWATLERTRRWLWFAVPAVVMAVPLVIWQLPEDGSSGRQFHTLWMLGLSSWERTVGDFFWFWLLNTGLAIPLVVLALVRWRELTLRWLPIFGLLLIPNVAIWHFWPGNNVKYVIFFVLLGAPLIGLVLADWWDRRGAMRLGAVLVFVSLTLSGTLDVWQAADGTAGAYPAPYLTGDDVLVGEWIRDNTPARAVFATANGNTHPVRVIAGRRVVSGSTGRLNDLGIDWVTRDQDLRTVYGVNEGFDDVIDRYDIDFVVLGPEERLLFRPDDAPEDWDPASFWDAAAPIVYDLGGYTVYDVTQYQGVTP